VRLAAEGDASVAARTRLREDPGAVVQHAPIVESSGPMVDLDAGTIAFLLAAAVVAGAVNAVAGGGSLISFPALLAVGYPALTANATNIVAVLPGYLGGSVAYRGELRGQGGRSVALGVGAAVGALVGSVLLLTLPASVFELVAPMLILVACVLLAAQPLVERLRARSAGSRGHRSPALHLLVFGAAVYGGYFGAALGIMLLAVLELALRDGLQRLNALKGLLSLVIGAVSALYLAVFGPVALAPAAIMAVGSLIGGHAGVSLARRLPARALRAVVVVYGVGVAIALLAT
jgi:uncharacterized membrane protein YfcA